MTLRASLWVPADVHFIVRLPSNNQFFRQSCRISSFLFLRGNATSELRQPQQ